MQIATLFGSRLLVAAAFAAPSIAAASIPPFCAAIKVPPTACGAESALGCTGSCPADHSNGDGPWNRYWERCRTTPRTDLSLVEKQFMCGSTANKLYVLHYAPADQWLCCIRNPFVDNGLGAEDQQK